MRDLALADRRPVAGGIGPVDVLDRRDHRPRPGAQIRRDLKSRPRPHRRPPPRAPVKRRRVLQRVVHGEDAAGVVEGDHLVVVERDRLHAAGEAERQRELAPRVLGAARAAVDLALRGGELVEAVVRGGLGSQRDLGRQGGLWRGLGPGGGELARGRRGVDVGRAHGRGRERLAGLGDEGVGGGVLGVGLRDESAQRDEGNKGETTHAREPRSGRGRARATPRRPAPPPRENPANRRICDTRGLKIRRSPDFGRLVGAGDRDVEERPGVAAGLGVGDAGGWELRDERLLLKRRVLPPGRAAGR